jgi:cysteine desulfurase/selenocysteine lyase
LSGNYRFDKSERVEKSFKKSFKGLFGVKMLNEKKVRKDFPIFKKNRSWIYFDSAATTQKPKVVIESLNDFYSNYYSTIHRGVYKMSMNATTLYDESRKKISEFINAKSVDEIVFTRGTTDSINLVASSLSKNYLKKGDEIISTEMEHHSNLVPWQMVAKEKGIKLKIVPINEKGELLLDVFESLLSSRTKLICIGHVANSTGTINPIEKMIKLAHERGAYVLIDGAQAVGHMKVDVQKLDADFYAFSGHKIYGPTGVGVLYGKGEILEKMPPVQGGGDMIENVELLEATYQEPPQRFEAGTTMFAEAIALKKAVEYLEGLGMKNVFLHDKKLLEVATRGLEKIEGVKIIGKAKNKSGIVSFIVDGLAPLDIGTFLDMKDIAIRVGHHCAQPLMKKFGIFGTARISFGVYNTKEEVERFLSVLEEVIEKLKS